MLTSLILSKFGGYIVAIVAAMAGVFSIYIRGLHDGKNHAQADIDAAKAETAKANGEAVAAKTEAVQLIAASNKQTEVAKETQNVQETVNALPADAAVNELRDEFSRDAAPNPASAGADGRHVLPVGDADLH